MANRDPRKERAEALLAEADGRLRLLESGRPPRLDGYAISPLSKLPFLVLRYRESLLWRIVQLGRSAFENFTNNKLASAILLTRATVETSAALWYLRPKLQNAVQSKTLDNIRNDLTRLSMGSRVDTDILPEAINVLNFVDRAENDIEGFRQQYDRLSEFAHPNWAGTILLFSKVDESRGVADFGESIRAADSAKATGAVNLAVSLKMFEASYNSITDLMPEFVSLCERQPGPNAQRASDEK
jgi:hypothetical protein